MSTRVYMVIRTANRSENIVPGFVVQSWRFQNLQERAFFADERVNWHCVANPFNNGVHASMAMITAKVLRDDETTVRIASQPREQREEAEQDMRALLATELQQLMLRGNIRLDFTVRTLAPGDDGPMWIETMAIIQAGSEGPQRRYFRYDIGTVDVHTA
ncbi:uncharacterized protein J4E92_005150 [Alternaria infectoria]|uniref:uncharacterized protein n=1 Tax=Alternaria infectoria TaxID=45303 RepID=UPI00221E455A|nr:uncharacterized protein J4E92_005150 [Alternaria infectoria]KAI4929486.1 hypothetical protein J4E92_005150 [Alternaria infectoria]